MSGRFLKYDFWITIMLIFIGVPCFSQNIQISDIFSGSISSIVDFRVNSEGQKFYILSTSGDSVLLNDDWIDLKPGWRSHFISTDSNKDIKFLVDLGGSNLVTLDSSIFLFKVFATDTFFVSDTFFIKEGKENSYNMLVLEYDFEGNYKRGKHWPSKFGSKYRTLDICALDNTIYITGTYWRDTLQLDDHKVGPRFKDDIFVAEIDSSLNCKWLKRMAYDDFDMPTSIDVYSRSNVLTAGYFTFGVLFACQDTFVNPYGWGTTAFMASMDSTGSCNGLERIHGRGYQIVWSAKYMSDASYVVAGYHSDTTVIGDTVLVGIPQLRKGFIAKYDNTGAVEFAIQFEGNQTQYIKDMVVTDDDNIWVCGAYLDNLIIGDFELKSTTPGVSDGFVAKFDRNGNVLFVNSFGGAGQDYFYLLEEGPDNSIYAVLGTKSDTLIVGSDVVAFNTDRASHVVIHIDEAVTGIKNSIPFNTNIQIYPNPVRSGSQITVDFDDASARNLRNISLHSLNGQLVASYEFEGSLSRTLQIPDISSAMYILNFDFGSFQVSKKIVVVR